MGLAACNITKPDTYFNGTSLYDSIINNSFEGTTGKVAYLNTGSREPESAIYVINNFRETPPVNGTVTFLPTRTNIFQGGVWTQDPNEVFIYNGGGTIPPASMLEPEVEMNYIGTGLRAAGLLLCAVILGLSIGFASWSKYLQVAFSSCLRYIIQHSI